MPYPHAANYRIYNVHFINVKRRPPGWKVLEREPVKYKYPKEDTAHCLQKAQIHRCNRDTWRPQQKDFFFPTEEGIGVFEARL